MRLRKLVDTSKTIELVDGVDGSIKKVGENVILCSPKNLGVAGDINLNSQD